MTINEQIADKLAYLYDSRVAKQWLATPQKLLDGAIPAQLIARGESKRVLDLLDAMLSGVFL